MRLKLTRLQPDGKKKCLINWDNVKTVEEADPDDLVKEEKIFGAAKAQIMMLDDTELYVEETLEQIEEMIKSLEN